MPHRVAELLGIVLLLSPWPTPAAELDTVLGRIDKAGATFRSLSAQLKRVSHTAVINEDNTDSGSMLLKRPYSRDMRMLVEFSQPDPKTIAFQGRKLEIYFPKMQTVQEFDVGKYRALLDEFLLIGFGTSKADLQASYQINLAGSESVGGQNCALLQLIPKSKDVLQHLTRLEIWVGENGYPLQQKFYQPGGDYMLCTYSDMKINPDLQDSALKLHLPKNVKREYPQK